MYIVASKGDSTPTSSHRVIVSGYPCSEATFFCDFDEVVLVLKDSLSFMADITYEVLQTKFKVNDEVVGMRYMMLF